MTTSMSREEFYGWTLQLLGELQDGEGAAPMTVTDEQAAGWSIWELGFDSTLLVELVLTLEDLGAPLPDTLPWDRISLAALYDAYVATTALDPQR